MKKYIIGILLLLSIVLRNKFFVLNVYETYYVISYSYLFLLIALILILKFVFTNANSSKPR